MGFNLHCDVDLINYASVHSGVASLIPVLHGVVTRMRMCLGSVHHHRGNEILFHCGFFMGLIMVMNVLSSGGDGDKVQMCKNRAQSRRKPSLGTTVYQIRSEYPWLKSASP